MCMRNCFSLHVSDVFLCLRACVREHGCVCVCVCVHVGIHTTILHFLLVGCLLRFQTFAWFSNVRSFSYVLLNWPYTSMWLFVGVRAYLCVCVCACGCMCVRECVFVIFSWWNVTDVNHGMEYNHWIRTLILFFSLSLNIFYVSCFFLPSFSLLIFSFVPFFLSFLSFVFCMS